MSAKQKNRDSLSRFLFENQSIRGEIIHLDSVWRAVLKNAAYPPVVENILGEAMAAVALLAAVLKLDGSVTLQIQADGKLPMLVAQCTSDQSLRGLAHWDPDVAGDSLAEICGTGNLSITIEPKKRTERFQGIVELGEQGLAQALEGYFAQSEQLNTRLWLAADGELAAGMMLQEMPGSSDDPDAWNRLTQLADTLQREELMGLEAEEVIHRLFHEEDIRLFDPWIYSFRCTCSREKIETVLKNLGYTEVIALQEEQGKIVSHCEFCNKEYGFDKVDVEALFTADNQPNVPKTQH